MVDWSQNTMRRDVRIEADKAVSLTIRKDLWVERESRAHRHFTTQGLLSSRNIWHFQPRDREILAAIKLARQAKSLCPILLPYFRFGMYSSCRLWLYDPWNDLFHTNCITMRSRGSPIPYQNKAPVNPRTNHHFDEPKSTTD